MSTPQGQEDTRRWWSAFAPYLPPLSPLAVALVVVILVNVAIPAVDLPVGTSRLVGIDVAIVAIAVAGGVYLRRNAAGTSSGRAWDRWERPDGTGSALPILVVGWILLVLNRWRDSDWWPFVLGTLLAVLVSAAVARKRDSPEARMVVPSRRPPEPADDHELVSLAWDVDELYPGLRGEIGAWVRRSKVAEFRPPRNPGTRVMPTADGGSRPAFEWYVEQGRCDEVDYLADQITSISKARGLTDYAEICLVLDLVQTIEYRLDDDPRHPGQTRRADYWRFPLETIADRAGDCEDSAILTVALLSSLGHRTCFFDLPGHAAIGVAGLPETTGTYVTASDGSWFYYTETTADGYAIGELPEEVQREDLRISAIVEPLRGRQRDPLLVPTRPGHWRRQSWAIAFSFAGMTAAAAALGFAVSYWA